MKKKGKKQRRDRERKARERRKERTLHAEKREFNLWMRLKRAIVNAQFVGLTLGMMKKIGSGLDVIGAFAGGTLVVSTSQKYLWTSTALAVSEMILVHYTCNVCMQSFSCSFEFYRYMYMYILVASPFFLFIEKSFHVSHDTSVKICVFSVFLVLFLISKLSRNTCMCPMILCCMSVKNWCVLWIPG